MRTFIILLLTTLIACNPADKNVKQVNADDTLPATKPTPVVTDSSVYILDTVVASTFLGDTLEQINKTLQFISDFDKVSISFSRDTFSVDEKTTEGCEIIAVQNKSSDFIELYGTLFGEMGKSEFQYYLLKGTELKLSCAIFTEFTYDKPMYLEDMQITGTEKAYQIYSGNKLIALLDGHQKKQNVSPAKLKETEAATRQFYKDYIGQIKNVKW